MDPLNAPLLIVWAVMAFVALFSLGGCVPHMNGPAPMTYYGDYSPPPPPYWNRPVPRWQTMPSFTCVRVGQLVTCS